MKNLFFKTLLLFIFTNVTFSQNFYWTKLETEVYPGKQDDITFVDENTGWYVNGFGKIFHTIDGGKMWEKQLEQKGSFLDQLHFLTRISDL